MRVALAFLLLLGIVLTHPAAAQVSTRTDRASREISRQIEARYPVIDDSIINDRVGTIVDRLGPIVGGEGFSWQFRVIANPTPNAFALPNGAVYVHEGLLDGLPGDGPLTDDELAFVLAHEMMHVVLNHGSRESGVSTSVQRVINRSGLVRSQAAQLVARLLRGSVEASYSRELETEADREALICVAQAGYAPEAALTLFDRMQQYQQSNGVTLRLFHTHPKATDRYANVRSWLERRATTVASKPAPRLPVTLLVVVDPATMAALTAPSPPSETSADPQATDASALPQGTDTCLENPTAASPTNAPSPEPVAVASAPFAARPAPPSQASSPGPAAPPLSAQRVAKRVGPLLDFTRMVTLSTPPQTPHLAALQQAAAARGADAILLLSVDKLEQQAMPWPDGVVYSVAVNLTAVLMRARGNDLAERFALHATQQATLSAQGTRTREDVRYETVEQALQGLTAPLRNALRQTAPSPPAPALPTP